MATATSSARTTTSGIRPTSHRATFAALSGRRNHPLSANTTRRSASIAERHIALAASHAIDFFSLDWWPNRPAQNDAIESGLSARGEHRRDPLLHLLRIDGSRRSREGGDIVFDAATKDRFVSDLMTIARRYFGHPSYLRTTAVRRSCCTSLARCGGSSRKRCARRDGRWPPKATIHSSSATRSSGPSSRRPRIRPRPPA